MIMTTSGFAERPTVCFTGAGAGNPETTLGPDGHLTTIYTYDGMNRMLSQTDAVGIVTTYIYDGRGNLIHQVVDYTADGVSGRNIVTEYTYNAYDQVLTERTSDNGLTIQNSTLYDINRQIALTQDGRGHATIYRYDDANQMINVIDPAGKVITYTYALDGGWTAD